ncbi:hypothetical protein [Hahella sp. HN01]|uniref:hypothetical protein n=1 Tax=Hahella sp. HN01 TaxID=2847262 RepID=UPI001C1EA3ED|nr:hypothetical protein [Hahella sp. HN01]MBU6953402.1 hypothetical protein [Hahella sp. HN01]
MAADLFPFSIQVKLDHTAIYSIPQKLDIVVRVNSDTQERDNLSQSTTEEYHPFGVTTVYSLGGGLDESYRPVRYSGRGVDEIGLSHMDIGTTNLGLESGLFLTIKSLLIK